ncbi:immunoglobulin-like domain-containing protein [Paenibacillus methanolicus]|uniref:5'-nucleotidase n=1 Tax=Paenibacillus methanolicus TaxID=582686 RepID=A0A5S5CLK8_9BACL|nr:immunoglobulin-like domain-containing protein [Paenibacillus methanolicus]TYP79585.1 5'-nucleotidase [Paenibacillus methanolicus]
MKRWLIGFMAAAMIVSGGSVVAADGGSSKHGGKPEYSEFCQDILASLQEKLNKTKDDRTKWQIRYYIDYFKKECSSNGSPTTSDSAKVAKDKEALRIGYREGDSAGSVTGPISLPTRGANGSKIAWRSSDRSVISDNGQKVTRHANADKRVKLTATLQLGRAKETKTFEVTVKRQGLSSQQKVALDAAALAISFNGGDRSDNVTQALKRLPLKGSNGSDIKWYSSAPQVISEDGLTVNRPANGAGDAAVRLTAIVRQGSAAQVKSFTLIVKQLHVSDADRARLDKSKLAIDFGGSDNAGSVTRPLDKLPTTGENGSTIVWSSSMPTVLSNDGKTLALPSGTSSMKIFMTAIITAGSYTDVKVFELTVKSALTDAERVAADMNALLVQFGSGDHISSVTKAIGLPDKGVNGSSVSWRSSNPSIVSDDGKTINRPANDTLVYMLATVRHNDVSDVKVFSLIVKART